LLLSLFPLMPRYYLVQFVFLLREPGKKQQCLLCIQVPLNQPLPIVFKHCRLHYHVLFAHGDRPSAYGLVISFAMVHSFGSSFCVVQ
jgi:hypothetical protein